MFVKESGSRHLTLCWLKNVPIKIPTFPAGIFTLYECLNGRNWSSNRLMWTAQFTNINVMVLKAKGWSFVSGSSVKNLWMPKQSTMFFFPYEFKKNEKILNGIWIEFYSGTCIKFFKPSSHAPLQGVDPFGCCGFLGYSGLLSVIDKRDCLLLEGQLCLKATLRLVWPRQGT